jgi:magnesium transporter
MTVTIQALRTAKLGWRWFFAALRRELATALLLGGGGGLLVALIVRFGCGLTLPAVVIGASVGFSIVTASLTGLGVPALLHALKLDPKIAAGPVTLALADVLTLLFYFSLAKYFL